MYDASYEQIQQLQSELLRNGITKEQVNLDNLAGATYRELKGVVNAAIAAKKKKEGNANA